MSITELAIHNVLRTYSRQDRLGRLQRPRAASSASATDKLDLSPKAQKLAVLGRTAEEIVTRGSPKAQGTEREELVRRQLSDLVSKHGGDLDNQSVTPDKLEESMKAAYLGK